jgi:HopA1 effector protein family
MSNHHQILAELVEKVQIDSNFGISHPDYPPIVTPPEVIERLQHMAPPLQRKYSIVQIQNYLYDIYFSHSLISLQAIVATAQESVQVKNNTINGVDINFYRQLQEHNPSHGYLDPDWQVVAKTDAGELVVVKAGLHLHIDPAQHLPPDLQLATMGDLVPIYLPPDLIGQDTYIMVGNFGSPAGSQSVQVYFNFTPDAALAIAQALSQELNRLGIPFQFAILHNPDLFHRYDAGMLWLSQTGYFAVRAVLVEIYQTHQAKFAAEIPLFTQWLAPGIAIAEEPDTAITFGLQRCGLIAIGLVTAIEQNKTAAADKLAIIQQEFMTAGIDWLYPYLNPTTTDPNPKSYVLFG